MPEKGDMAYSEAREGRRSGRPRHYASYKPKESSLGIIANSYEYILLRGSGMKKNWIVQRRKRGVAVEKG